MRHGILLFALSGACADDAVWQGDRAGVVTWDNLAQMPGGPSAGARPGDVFLRNDQVTFVVQRPGREMSVGPYGGSLIDAAPRGEDDAFGELVPALALCRTVEVERLVIVADGRDGGDAVVEGYGHDARNVYYNLQGVAPDLFLGDEGLLAYPQNDPLHLDVTVRYRLPPDARTVELTYLFRNSGQRTLRLPISFLLDSRGTVETFTESSGFVTNMEKRADQTALSALLAVHDPVDQIALLNPRYSVGILPWRLDDRRPRTLGLTIPTLGGALVLEAQNALAAGEAPALIIPAGATGTMALDVTVAGTLDQVLAHGWDRLNIPHHRVDGCTGTPGSRVGLSDADGRTPVVFTAGPDGCFGGQAPRGDYVAHAGRLYDRSLASGEVTVPADAPIDLRPTPWGRLRVDVESFLDIHSQAAAPAPCRVTLFGEPGTLSHPALGHAPLDAPESGYRLFFLRTCAETLDVAPGRYLVVVTRGPEFSKLEAVVTVASGESASVAGHLRRAVDSAGWVGSDFHVHSVYSMDSRVPPEDRVLSLAGEGLGFWASLEHDFIADYTQTVASLGLDHALRTVPGSEVTTFDTGHFGAFPLVPSPDHWNGDSPDWAANPGGVRPPIQTLFDAMHDRGAVVQVNHPRSHGLAVGAYFSRAGLAYHPITGQPYANVDLAPVAPSTLGYADNGSAFSMDFDVIEVMNGNYAFVAGDGMVHDYNLDQNGGDWLRLLDAGWHVTATANSDTHTLGRPPGSPRTYVRDLDAGPRALVTALAEGRAVLSNGPFLTVTAEGVQVGQLLESPAGMVTLSIAVQTPDWFDVDILEVLGSGGGTNFRLGPLVPIATQEVTRPNGATARVAELSLDVSIPPGVDGWLMVRVGGRRMHLFPWELDGGGTLNLSADTPDEFLADRTGEEPFAATNPIFIDGDGDGRWHGRRPVTDDGRP